MRLRWDRKDEQEREGTSLSNCNITAVAVVILVIKGAAEIVNLGMCSVSKFIFGLNSQKDSKPNFP